MKGKAVTLYGMHYDDDGVLDLGSCEAREGPKTYYARYHPSWLGYRTIFPKDHPLIHLSPEAAIDDHLVDCREEVVRAEVELLDAQRRLKDAEAFKAGWRKGEELCGSVVKPVSQ